MRDYLGWICPGAAEGQGGDLRVVLGTYPSEREAAAAVLAELEGLGHADQGVQVLDLADGQWRACRGREIVASGGVQVVIADPQDADELSLLPPGTSRGAAAV